MRPPMASNFRASIVFRSVKKPTSRLKRAISCLYEGSYMIPYESPSCEAAQSVYLMGRKGPKVSSTKKKKRRETCKHSQRLLCCTATTKFTRGRQRSQERRACGQATSREARFPATDEEENGRTDGRGRRAKPATTTDASAAAPSGKEKQKNENVTFQF